MAEVKREVRGVIEAVRTERLDRGVGAVVFQGYNTLLKAAETERRIRETEELEERIARLEQQQERDKWRRTQLAPTLLERRSEALEEADKQTAAIEFRERLTAVSDEEIARCIEEP